MSDPIRKHLLQLLSGRGAHISFEDAVEGWPAKLRGVKPDKAPHTAWQLVEHLRIAQWDLLEFSRDPKHESPKWPEGYWPETAAPPNDKAWDESVAKFKGDLEAMRELVAGPKLDLLAPCPPDCGKPLFRNALVLADHNSYHVGQLMFLRKMLGA
jgi:hypothetical protein